MKRYLPVVHLDRRQKARMIEAILADYLRRPVNGYRTLDIGCGNGDISEALAQSNEHHAVDVKDQRRNKDASFDFRLVTSERLPFDDEYFDIVVSHHVIEHVQDQHLHLQEIRRVTRPDGIAYLATPNRTSPIMKGHVGNKMVLSYGGMLALFREHGFHAHEYGSRVAGEPDRFHGEVRLARLLPAFAIRWLRPLFPSQMFVLAKAAGRPPSPSVIS